MKTLVQLIGRKRRAVRFPRDEFAHFHLGSGRLFSSVRKCRESTIPRFGETSPLCRMEGRGADKQGTSSMCGPKTRNQAAGEATSKPHQSSYVNQTRRLGDVKLLV